MITGYPVVHRMTQAEFDAGAGLTVTGGFIEIVNSNDVPVGPVYVTGPAGSPPELISSYAYRTAGESIAAFKVVYDVDGVNCRLASSSDPSTAEQILGVSMAGGSAGTLIPILRSGVFTLNTGFTPGVLFLGTAGNITHGPATSGVHVQVGNTISSTVSDIDIKTPIYL